MPEVQVEDRVLYLPIVLAVVAPTAFVLSCSSLFAFLNPLLVLSFWIISGAGAGIMSIAWLYQRAWRRLLSTSILLVTVLIAGLNLGVVWHTGQHWGAYVDQYLLRSRQ